MASGMSESDTATRLAVHEAVSNERWSNIQSMLRDGDKRMSKIEILLYLLIVAVLLGPGTAAEFVRKLVGI